MTFKVPFQVKQFCVFQCLIYAASAAEGAENKKRFKKKKKKSEAGGKSHCSLHHSHPDFGRDGKSACNQHAFRCVKQEFVKAASGWCGKSWELEIPINVQVFKM